MIKAFAFVALAFAAHAGATVEVVDWEYRDASTGTPVTFVEPGAPVTWRIEQGIHTIRDVGGAFASGVLVEGDQFTTTPPEGVSTYYCEIHEWMRGVVVAG